MGKKTTVQAPAADPNIGIAAEKQAQLGMDWLEEAKRQFNTAEARQVGIDALTERVVNQQIGASEQAQQWATEDRARYKDTFVPMQDAFIEKAKNWDSPERQAAAAAEARADVMSAAATGRQIQQRQASAMGIDPTSGRYAGVDRAGELGTTLAAAGAENTARNQVRQQGIALQGEAINLGSGLAVNPGASLGLGVSAGGAAAGTAVAGNANARANAGILESGYKTAMGGYGQQAAILGAQDGRALSAWETQTKANAQSTAGLFGGLGMLGGAAMSLAFRSSKDAKENKKPVRGALEAIRGMPVEQWDYKEGEGDGGRHIGPYAEDFQRQTGLGDGQSINIVDAIGIGLRATQELAEEVRDLRRGLPPMDGKRPARPKARSMGITPDRRAA